MVGPLLVLLLGGCRSAAGSISIVQRDGSSVQLILERVLSGDFPGNIVVTPMMADRQAADELVTVITPIVM